MSTELNAVENDLNDDVIINYTQRKRKQLVEVIVKEGMPVATDDRMLLLSALDGLSKTAIQRKRLGVEEASNENTKAATLAVSKILSAFGDNNPFIKTVGGSSTSAPAPALDQLPAIADVPGETEIGVVQNDFTTFIASQNTDGTLA